MSCSNESGPLVVYSYGTEDKKRACMEHFSVKGSHQWASQLGIFGLIFESVIRFEWGYAKKDCTGPLESALLCSTLSVLLSLQSC